LLEHTTDVGKDAGSPVSDDYVASDSAFNGDIHWVKRDVADDGTHAHLVDPEGLLKVAMMRQ
jgi:arylsulfatase